ncbi:MAG: DUF58 domain-containing protein [candidate division WOR-3 bacterium]|nr:DUF58 domain-containing protein [candidate division WOR-3 bacterium]MCX7947960.1 DUF58 domain-containing protein [candidate division WOR-3 bacterium]MDW8150904.1 DUF58 domain-containing protein [candidate division WOR-3 bacterium]
MKIEDLLKIENLYLRAKKVVEGYLSGKHKSIFQGFSVEFAEHREYTKGDDFKFIDWKVLARKDKLFIKKFYEETNLRAYLLLDISKSMDFGKPNKFIFAQNLCAILSYILYLQRDAFGFIAFSDKLEVVLNPSSSKIHLYKVLRTLSNLKPSGKTYIENPLLVSASKLKRKGLVILISDLIADKTSTIRILRAINNSGFDVVVFQILSPQEREIEDRGNFRFVEPETKTSVLLNTLFYIEDYKVALNSWLNEIKESFLKSGIRYKLLFTDEPITNAFKVLS